MLITLIIKKIIILITIIFFIQGCVTRGNSSSQPTHLRTQKDYSADRLIKEWRNNIEARIPLDNDAEYNYPSPMRYQQVPGSPIIVSPYSSPYGYPYPLDNDSSYRIPYQMNNMNPYNFNGRNQLLPADNDAEYSYPLYFDE